MSFRHACLKDVFIMSLRCLLDMRVVWVVMPMKEKNIVGR